MSLERIILISSLALNLFLVIFAIALWPDRLFPGGLFFYQPKYSANEINQPASPLKTANFSAGAAAVNISSQSLFLNSQVAESFRPIRDYSFNLPIIETKAAAVYLLDDSRFLFSQNIDQALPIASLTKLMTAVIALEYFSKDQAITIESSFLETTPKSQFLVGEPITVENLLYIMLVSSNNEAADILSQNLKTTDSGNQFIALMNQKATDLGMSKTFFVDPAGLKPENISSINDLIKLTEYISANHPLIWQIAGLKNIIVLSADKKISHRLTSTNWLWGLLDGLIAGKTGYTDEAGQCLLIISQAPNQTGKLLAMILGSNDRFGQMLKLIEGVKKAYLW